MLDFKEDVAVLASESPVGRTGPLAAWADSPPVGPRGLARRAGGLRRDDRPADVVVCRDVVAAEWLLAWLFIELGAASVWRRPFHRVLHGIDTPERDLGLLAGLLARIESNGSPRRA